MIIPLVLHRIVAESGSAFEDISVHQFEAIVSRIVHGLIRPHEIASPSDRLRSWVLTFDDGCESDYTVVFPRLSAYGASATSLIVPSWIGQPGFLSWAQVRELSAAGMTIGSHSQSHPLLVGLPEARVKAELAQSKDIIEQAIGCEVVDLSFPYGRYDHGTVQVALEVGYRRLFTSSHGVVRNGEYVLPRNSLNRRMSSRAVEETLAAPASVRVLWSLEDVSKRLIWRLVGPTTYRWARDRLFRDAR